MPIRHLIVIICCFLASEFCFGNDKADIPAVVEADDYLKVSFLLRNKGFLDEQASQEIAERARNLTDSQRIHLYNTFKLVPGFLFQPPTSSFSFFPLYENTTPKLVIGILGGIGFVAMLGVVAFGRGDNSGSFNPVVATIGISGWATALGSEVYLLGLPIWEPQGYDPFTVNRAIGKLLGLN